MSKYKVEVVTSGYAKNIETYIVEAESEEDAKENYDLEEPIKESWDFIDGSDSFSVRVRKI